MGEIADMMLEGQMCQGCGEILGQGDGYPVFCKGCQREMGLDAYGDKIDAHNDKQATTKGGEPINRPSKVNCPECNKLVKKAGLAMHRKDVHGVEK